MSFPNLQLTDAGRAIIVKSFSGVGINFTKIQIGNGEEPDDISSMTTLQNPLKDIGITDITLGEGIAMLNGEFDNAELDSGFYWKELGVFAEDEDTEAGEVLYAYSYAGNYAEYIPTYTGTCYLKTTINVAVVVGDTENVSAVISSYSGYANSDEFNAHLEDYDNPHKVTKSQVGLGNVENYSLTSSPVRITELEDDAELSTVTTSDTFATAFGKIKRAITNLIDHIANKSNPHEVTCKQVGAAAEDHTHSGADITSGTLGTARGGTGLNSLVANRLYYADSTSSFTYLNWPFSYNMTLMQGYGEAPYWGYTTYAGSYTGAGTYGSSNRNEVSVVQYKDRISQILEGVHVRFAIIYASSASAAEWKAFYNPHATNGFIAMSANVVYSLSGGITTPSAGSGEEGTLYWYSTASAKLQGNTSGVTYTYILFF